MVYATGVEYFFSDLLNILLYGTAYLPSYRQCDVKAS